MLLLHRNRYRQPQVDGSVVGPPQPLPLAGRSPMDRLAVIA